MENFNSAYYQMNLLYGTELSPEEFEEIGLIAWHKIGNRRTRLYRYVTDIQCPDNTVDLPCNCDIIEAVTYGFEEWNYVTNWNAYKRRRLPGAKRRLAWSGQSALRVL